MVRNDFTTYQKLRLKDRFGLNFHTHKDVCTATIQGRASCNARVLTTTANVPLSTTTTPYVNALGPAQFLKAYNLTGTASQPQVVAIVDAYDDPFIYNDLTTYSQQYGIPVLPQCVGAAASSSVPCFQKMNQNGSTTSYPNPDPSWSLEIALDVEAVHAVCQNCTILLVEANSSSFADLTAADDQAVAQGAKIISNSWGGPGDASAEAVYDTHYNKPGVAFLFSSGDSGYGLEYPATSPYVVAVGGTSLFLNADGSYNTETAWSGAGSGCSTFETKPSWQTDTNCTRRTATDVSAVADPNTGASVYDSYQYSGMSGWFEVGGTSLSSPIAASVYALAGTPPTAVAANSIPYSNASKLHDVTSGSNGTCGGSYLCTAGVGYDGPTGLGTPNGIGGFVYAPNAPTAILTATPTTIVAGNSSTLTWNSTNTTSCTGTNFSTGGAVSGSVVVSPTASTTYSVSCTGTNGTAAANAMVTVTQPVPTASLSASPATIVAGNSSSLTWNSTNATSCTGTNFSTSGTISGSVVVSPTASTTYSVSCTGTYGTVVANAKVTVTPPAPTASLGANPTSIVAGNTSVLSWASTNATSCTGTNFSTGNAKFGSVTVAPTATTAYSVSCAGAGGTGTASTIITVTQPALTVSLSASPSSIVRGQTSKLTWGSTGATSCTGTNFSTSNAKSGSVTVSPTVTTTYTATCTGSSGTKATSATVTVTTPAPTASLSASPTFIRKGQTSKLTWSSTNATSCTGANFSTGTNTSGSVTVTPTQSTTYSLSCTGAGGSVTKTTSVSVR